MERESYIILRQEKSTAEVWHGQSFKWVICMKIKFASYL